MIDTNAIKFIPTFCSTLLFKASSNKWTSKAVALSKWRQNKARQRCAHAFQFNLFLWVILCILHSA